MEVIAPYGQGTAAALMRWLKRNVPEKVSTVGFVRNAHDVSQRSTI